MWLTATVLDEAAMDNYTIYSDYLKWDFLAWALLTLGTERFFLVQGCPVYCRYLAASLPSTF
jgi:hypothetical protein